MAMFISWMGKLVSCRRRSANKFGEVYGYGKSWENHSKTWENHRETQGKSWEDGAFWLGNGWENHGKVGGLEDE